ncbi:MAG: hypothetical protein ACM3KR_08290 [Deltaproteobacteria bacterium]
MKSTAKILLSILTFTLLFTFVFSFMACAAPITPGDIKDTNSFGTNDQASLQKLSGFLLSYVWSIGAVAAVIVLAVYGIQWLMASPQQKAMLKEKLWAYVIGAVLIFGATSIMSIIAGTITKSFG